MAIDSANKRRSASSRPPTWRVAALPDGAIAGVDKQQIVGRYCGIAAGEPVAVVTPIIIRRSPSSPETKLYRHASSVDGKLYRAAPVTNGTLRRA